MVGYSQKQDSRKQNSIYLELELSKASIQTDIGFNMDMVDHHKVSSAKVLGSRRVAVPLVSYRKTHEFDLSDTKNHQK